MDLLQMQEVLKEKVIALMKNNQAQSGQFRYVRPGVGIYEQQWLWDSCFHILINSSQDLQLAKDELLALLSHQVEEELDYGMLPHMIYWTGDSMELWHHPTRSRITQPPVVAMAALSIFEQSGDNQFLKSVYPAVANFYRWLKTRDWDNDHLVSIVHPWESGWDNSARWDKPMGFQNDPINKQLRHELAQRLWDIKYDPERIQANNMFNVEPVDFNAIYAENLTYLAKIADIVGDHAGKKEWELQAAQTKRAILDKCWDEELGLFVDLAGTEEEPVRVKTPAGMIPIYAGIPNQQQVEQIVAHIINPQEFWCKYPLPTVALDEPVFDADSYWRGTTWININWFVIRGLERYGYSDLANSLAEKSVELVYNHGFWEYYNPITGKGLGSENLGWSALVATLKL